MTHVFVNVPNYKGADVLGAVGPSSTGGFPGENFGVVSGSYVASAQISGILAMLKQKYPYLSPSALKSALMTTADPTPVASYSNGIAATPFEVGSGLARATQALSPGIVYATTSEEYEAFSCGYDNYAFIDSARCAQLACLGYSFDASDLNYPSMAADEILTNQTFIRTVTNIADQSLVLVPTIEAPTGYEVSICPEEITVKPGESATFELTVQVIDDRRREKWSFGSLTWVGTNRGVGKGSKHRGSSSKCTFSGKPSDKSGRGKGRGKADNTTSCGVADETLIRRELRTQDRTMLNVQPTKSVRTKDHGYAPGE